MVKGVPPLGVGSLPPSGFKVALFTVTGKGYWKRCDRLDPFLL